VFPFVVTVELEPRRWRRSRDGYDVDGVQFLLGDSAVIVPLLAKAYCDEPVFWFLDAHWFRVDGHKNEFGLPVADTSPVPLWGEVRGIMERRQADVVCVDDVHAFGREDSGLDGWSGITKESLDERLHGRLVSSMIVGDVYVAYLNEGVER
jgi:hypothetical protein